MPLRDPLPTKLEIIKQANWGYCLAFSHFQSFGLFFQKLDTKTSTYKEREKKCYFDYKNLRGQVFHA